MAPRVDFYVLPESTTPLRFTCDMVGRMRAEELNVHIHSDSRTEAVALDTLMWTFRDISFLPHVLADVTGAAPITLGWPGQAPRTHEVLINLSRELPGFAGDFRRVIEPVPAAPEAKAASRARYKQYREWGWELFNHTPDSDHANQ